MTDKAIITLEGRGYEVVTPLKLGQLRALRVAVALPQVNDPQDDADRTFRRAVDIVAAALSAEHPDITADALMGMRVTDNELREAVTAALVMAGLRSAPADEGKAEAEAK